MKMSYIRYWLHGQEFKEYGHKLSQRIAEIRALERAGIVQVITHVENNS